MIKEAKRFKKDLVKDFYHLHSHKNRTDWCYCAAWWVDSWDGWSDRTAEENRKLREELLASGEYDGYLLYLDQDPVGWCQVGRRDRLKKLTRQFDLDPDPGTWAITCFLIAPEKRRAGLAQDFLGLVLADLLSRSVKRVEAFPRRGQGLDEQDLWNGPESMFINAGFSIVRDHPERPLLALEL